MSEERVVLTRRIFLGKVGALAAMAGVADPLDEPDGSLTEELPDDGIELDPRMLELREGDTLWLDLEYPETMERIAEVKRYVEEAFPGARVMVSHGVKPTIIRRT